MANKKQTPEEVELGHKEEMLKEKQETLTERELELSTLQADLHSFEMEYYLKVGEKFVHLDRLQATLDNIFASKAPKDIDAKRRAAESNRKAQQSRNDAEQHKQLNETRHERFEASPELKSLYRELAKLLHPDLTLDPKEKERRHGLMQLINEAYQSGDLNRLNDIWEAERNNPENVKGDDIGSSLVRLIRKIDQIEKRIAELDQELSALKKTDLHILFVIVRQEERKGINWFDKKSAELDYQITFLQGQIQQANQ